MTEIDEIYDKSNKKNLSNENIIKGIVKADVISRIFSLTDVCNNTTNFGFIGDKFEDFKLVDFRVKDVEFYIHFNIYNVWESGNH
jgi:hypothetical protein